MNLKALKEKKKKTSLVKISIYLNNILQAWLMEKFFMSQIL